MTETPSTPRGACRLVIVVRVDYIMKLMLDKTAYLDLGGYPPPLPGVNLVDLANSGFSVLSTVTLGRHHIALYLDHPGLPLPPAGSPPPVIQPRLKWWEGSCWPVESALPEVPAWGIDRGTVSA